jgi:hypothetical protein
VIRLIEIKAVEGRKKYVQGTDGNVETAQSCLSMELVERALITARVPARHFGEIDHLTRCHYALNDPRQVGHASRQLQLAQVSYRAKLEICPICREGLILTIKGEKP